MSDDDYMGMSNLESSQDVSMGFGVSGLTQRPADEDTDPYNFEINIKGSSNADATPWMTEEERREKKKPKKKVVKAGDTSAMSKANKWLKKAKKKKEKKHKKKVETLENLSLSEDDMSSDLDSDSGSSRKPKKRSMQFKVPTASSRGMTRSSALSNLRTFDDEDLDDMDRNGVNIAESFSKAKVSPQANKLPGGLEAFMSSSQRSDDANSMKVETRSKRREDKYNSSNNNKKKKKSSSSAVTKSEVFGNVMSFGDIDTETSTTTRRNEALGKIVSFEDHMKEELETNRNSNDKNNNNARSNASNVNININNNNNRSEAFGVVKSFDDFNSVPVKNEAFGNVRGIEDLGMIDDDDDDQVEEVSMEESIGVEELINDEVADKSSSNNNRNENSYRHNPTPPPLQSQLSNVTDYSMEDFEQDGYSMDDFETSIQESTNINNSSNNNNNNNKKKSRKPLSTLNTNDNDMGKGYRGPSPRAKSAKLRTSPANANRTNSNSRRTVTREIGIQASSGVDIGIQAEMVPLPPLGMDPYMYHMGLGRSQFGMGAVHGGQYGASGLQNNPYIYPRFGGQQYWAQPRASYQPSSQSQGKATTSPQGESNNANIDTSVEDPPIDNFSSKVPPSTSAYQIPTGIQSQLSESNDLFKRQLALIRQQIDKSRNRALQAQAAMHYKTYEIIKQQTTTNTST